MTDIQDIQDIPLPSIGSAAVLAELSIGAWNPTRLDRRVTAEVHAHEGVSSEGGKYVKSLFPGVPQFGRIKALELRARAVHKDHTMAWGDSGQRLLVTGLIPEYETALGVVEQEFWAQVQDIEGNYPTILQHCQAKLGATFDLSLYPKQQHVAQQFKFRAARVPVPEVGDFRCKMGEDAVRIMKEEFKKHLRNIQETIVQDVRTSTKDVLQKMSDRLAFDGEDDKKIFRNSLVTNVTDWTARMGAFNDAVKSDEIGALQHRVEAVMAVVNPELLRVNADVRKEVKGKVDAILSSMQW